MAGHRGLAGINREGIMSGEEGADQWMSCRDGGMRMQMNERHRKRDERYELRDHQEHPNWDKWAVCQVPPTNDPAPLIGLRLQPMPCSERSSCPLRQTSAVNRRRNKEFCWRLDGCT